MVSAFQFLVCRYRRVSASIGGFIFVSLGVLAVQLLFWCSFVSFVVKDI
jgi:hypothetical protein